MILGSKSQKRVAEKAKKVLQSMQNKDAKGATRQTDELLLTTPPLLSSSGRDQQSATHAVPTPSGTHSNLPQYPFPIMATSLTTKNNWRPINAQKLREVEFLPFVQHQQHSQQNFYQSP